MNKNERRAYLAEQEPYADALILDFISHLKLAGDETESEQDRAFARKIATIKMSQMQSWMQAVYEKVVGANSEASQGGAEQ